MKNVEFGEAFGLEEAARKARVSELDLLRMAGRGEVSVWFKLLEKSKFFDQNDKVVELPEGWLRVTAREAKLFIEDDVVGIKVFENQDGECYYPAADTRLVREVVGGAVMADDRYPHRYFGHSEAVPTAPTFKKYYSVLGKDDLFFVPSEIEAIAERQTDSKTNNTGGKPRTRGGVRYSGEQDSNMKILDGMIRLATENKLQTYWKKTKNIEQTDIIALMCNFPGYEKGESTLQKRFPKAKRLLETGEPSQEEINPEERTDLFIIAFLIKLLTDPQKNIFGSTKQDIINEIHKESQWLMSKDEIGSRLASAKNFCKKSQSK